MADPRFRQPIWPAAARAGGDALLLVCDDPALAEEISRHRAVSPLLCGRADMRAFRVALADRGRLKQALLQVGYPAEDLAGYTEGEELSITLWQRTRGGAQFELRGYQSWAVRAFHAGGSARGGSGVIVLPCGAGKTVVGVACMAELGTSTLILTTGITASRQWAEELLDKSSLDAADLGLYDGTSKEIRPVTIATYNILTPVEAKTTRSATSNSSTGATGVDHLRRGASPARAGIPGDGESTGAPPSRPHRDARVDGREDDVFALIGPKKMDVPWKSLEREGWIARAACTEFRLPLPAELRMPYALADARSKFRIAAENPAKLDVVRTILDQHPAEPALVMEERPDDPALERRGRARSRERLPSPQRLSRHGQADRCATEARRPAR